ncbi:MAG: acyltransferase [Candidatus Pacebacteria bacterium]|nr:acyltransferase [Candidatus Paceibacterota bacterium]MBP9842557.1 acyltransferase [Candidatus Paceibacterota bacterium]
MQKPHYRPDIDGLRALAVIPVILFHLKIAGFGGGFIGVDIFFVISGYLITSIIMREIREERFSMVRFWERRILRILPALFFVLVVTTIASYFVILFPTDFISFGQSLAAQGLFIVNIFFMRTGDYFAAPAETIPLLHTWSLAVEEQFYIVFPILLVIIYKLSKKAVIPVVALIGLVSFVLSVYLINVSPSAPFTIPFLPHIWGSASYESAGFYFPLARAWELAAGALLALSAFTIRNKVVAEVSAVTGLVLIVSGIVFLTSESAFPGLAALLPVLGTVLIITAGTQRKTFIGEILSFPVLVWVGLISYSLYLWHWPLIVLTKQYLSSPLTGTHTGLILIATFLLAIFSYHFVETPFRKKTFLKKRWHIFTFAFFTVVATVSAGVYMTKNKGLPERAPEAAKAVALASADTNPREYECFRNNYRQILGEVPPCIIGDQSSNTVPTFVLWGDSHSNAIMPAFDNIAKERGARGVFFAIGGCPPLSVGIPLKKDPQCSINDIKVLDYISKNNIKTVFLVSSWKENYPHITDGGNHTIYQALSETIDKIPNSTHVVIIERIPLQTEFNIRSTFYTAVRTGSVPDIAVKKSDHEKDTLQSKAAILRLTTERDNVSSVDPATIICDEAKCPISYNGTIIYFDGGHINNTGALLLKPLLEIFVE